jgi:nucleoside-diphosphate-sugar epimerase
MRALVTGGCGFIGSNIVKSLHSEGWEIDIVDDMSNGHYEFLDGLEIKVVPCQLGHIFDDQTKIDKNKILVLEGDFVSDEIVRRVVEKKYDVIFHCAANPRVEYSVQNPLETTNENLMKTVRLFTHSIGNVKRIVFSSSCSVYGDPKDLPTSENQEIDPNSPYALQKLSCEHFAKVYCKLYDLDIVCLRYFNVYGPNQYGGSPYSTAIVSWCDKVKNDQPLRSDGDGTQTRDMVFVEDVARANLLAASREKDFLGECINIGTGESLSNNEILEIFNSKFPDLKIVNAPPRPGDVKHTLCCTQKAEKELGFKAHHDLKQGIEKVFEWWGFNE